jgi:putative two-component system response regulator
MPEMDGFETIRQFKADPELSPIPVIFLTGNQDSATEIRALESGAMDFITKPANRDILLHRIELHLQFAAYQTSLEHTVMELENNIVTSFAELIECKEDNMGGHILRAGKCVEIIGRHLLEAETFGGELTENDLTMIVRATPFHDIGKIGISDVLLLKKGALTEDEYREVQKHTIIGAQFLEKVYARTPDQHYLKFARQIAESHHERYDGKGYPHCLAGNEIPLCARLIAVANVFDSCMTDRVYRKALGHEAACRIISEGRGSAFDPLVVDAFEVVKDKLAVLDTDSLPIVKIRKRTSAE